MRRTAALSVLAAAVTVTLLAPVPATAGDHGPDGHGPQRVVQPTLVARATLSADFLAPGPPSGALATPANGRQGPFAGQVIPGFSGMVDAGDGTFWALPDNGFGTKANSADFLLRLYRVTPDWQTARGGSGELGVGEFVSLRDPDRHVDFPIVNDATPERLLTLFSAHPRTTDSSAGRIA
jgi:glycerophosphoryl diester phosphodiesterase